MLFVVDSLCYAFFVVHVVADELNNIFTLVSLLFWLLYCICSFFRFAPPRSTATTPTDDKYATVMYRNLLKFVY